MLPSCKSDRSAVLSAFSTILLGLSTTATQASSLKVLTPLLVGLVSGFAILGKCVVLKQLRFLWNDFSTVPVSDRGKIKK